MAYIYKITNLINGKTYVGQHNGKNNWYFCSGTLIKKAIKKYGKDNFKKEIIIEGNFNNLLLDELETHYIRLYSPHRTSNSYNLVSGGKVTRDYKHSKETKKLMSSQRFGKRLGKDNYFYGKRFLGKDNPSFGKKKSEEQKQKASNFMKTRIGILNSAFGTHWAEERKIKQSLKIGIPIIQLDLNNNFIVEWRSSRHAAISLGLSQSRINLCCRKPYLIGHNFKWKFKNITNE